MAPKKAPAQTSPEMSSLASNILAGRKIPTKADAISMAASLLRQDQTPGQKPKSR